MKKQEIQSKIQHIELEMQSPGFYSSPELQEHL